jgi:hypothetical protein
MTAQVSITRSSKLSARLRQLAEQRHEDISALFISGQQSPGLVTITYKPIR